MEPIAVIGSGPSGATAADILTSRGIPVVVLEAGRRFPGGQLAKALGRTIWRRHAEPITPADFRVSGDPSTLWTVSHSPGGLSNYWTGAVPRYSPEDFTDGARAGTAFEWPVGYADLQNYYQYAERLLRIVGAGCDYPSMPRGETLRTTQLPRDWMRLAERAAVLGETIAPTPLAAGQQWMFARRSTPFNSYTEILRKRASTSIRLLVGAQATSLVWNAAQARVCAIEYFDHITATPRSIPVSAAVLACGAIDTPRLLLNSTSNRFPRGLGNDAGLVGKYLLDHPHHMFALTLDRPMSRLGHTAVLARRPVADTAPFQGAQCTLGGRLTRLDRALAAVPLKTRRLGVVVFGSMRPKEENRVMLDPCRTDEAGLPIPDIRIEFSAGDLETTYDAERRLMALLEHCGISPRLDWRLERITPGSAVHYAGTARMHVSEGHGVVDPDGAVFGAPNVVVADASVFTTCVEKNPTLTAMALAARSADRLAQRLRGNL